MMKCKTVFLTALCVAALGLNAAVKFPAIFSDRAVLAKRDGVPVFGTAAPGEKVVVKFNGQIKETAAGPDGKWLVRLDLANSPEGPFELQINDKIIKDVIVGEVFLGSGQSNMEYNLLRCIGYKEACKLPENTRIRHFKVSNRFATEPRSDMGGRWVYANGSTLGSFSALGYFFAKKLHDTLNVPVGIVNSSWGGTRLESWMSKESLTVPSAVKMGEARIAALESYPERFQKFLDDTAAWEKKYGREDIPVVLPGADAKWKPYNGDGISGGGVWWIKNKFTISASDAARQIHIYFGRVYAPAKVFVDGKELFSADAAHAWKNNPFGKYVKAGTLAAGEHEVLVRYYISHDYMHLPQPFRFGSYNIDGKGWKIWQEKSFPKCSGKMLAERPRPLGAAPSPATQWFRLYNAMIHPLIPYRFSGVIWYQGEANANQPAEYSVAFAAMIKDWRKKFQVENLPFYFCQLASYRLPVADPNKCGTWPALRQAQAEALKLPATGMVVITDAGEALDIHPRNKQLPGERMAALALKNIYGKNVPSESPMAVRAVFDGISVNVSFSHTDGGLTAHKIPENFILKTSNSTSRKLVRRSPGTQLEGFALCGADGKWYWADNADISGDKVTVFSRKVNSPVKVRYNWTDNPFGNLFSKAGFPVAPFEITVEK